MLQRQVLSGRVIGLAIEVHRQVGSGLLESVYAERIGLKLADAGIPFQRQVLVPVVYKGVTIPTGFRAYIAVAHALGAVTGKVSRPTNTTPALRRSAIPAATPAPLGRCG